MANQTQPVKIQGCSLFGKHNETMETDFLIIGSGIAGLSLALKLSQLGHVVVICKRDLSETNTSLAQGGIAAVSSKKDSFSKHIKDTFIAGAGLCNRKIVETVVKGGPKAIKELTSLGVDFSRSSAKSYHLTKEGGHSERRIYHKNDMTGAEIQNRLAHSVLKSKNITILEHHMAIDLISSNKFCPSFSGNKCFGTYVLDTKKNKIFEILARETFLATGGHGKLYLYTTNPDVATGDGVAIAWRAGAYIANLEFMQFHPTCLYNTKIKNFLISEVLRGEGGVLLSYSGKPFMEGIHPKKELAPRDIVARAIDAEMKKTGAPHVYLDVTHKGLDFIQNHFPGIYKTCLEIGLDISKDPIPVVPAAHYSCGGVVTNEYGETNIQNLWALGETACTGLHGANRLASNSLLEGLIFADVIFQKIKKSKLKKISFPKNIPKWLLGKACEPDEATVVTHLWEEIRRTMWDYVGIVRTDKRLARANARIRQINQEIEDYYWDVIPNQPLLELRNLAILAELTINCARLRKESRGIHYSLDYPETNDKNFKKDTILS